MNRFLVLGSALLCSTLFAGLFVVSSANAASDYDNVYQVTDKLIHSGEFYEVDEDVSTKWSDLFMKDEGLGDNITPIFTFYNSPATHQQIDDMRNSFNTAFNGDGRWTVSNHCWDSGGFEFCDINITWSEDDTLSLAWDPTYVYSINHDYKIKISQNTGNNGDKRYRVYITSYDSAYISSSDGSIKSYIAYANPNYPEGYAGEPIKDSHTLKSNYKPEFSWLVMNKNIKATHLNTDKIPTQAYQYIIDDGYIIEHQYIFWSLYHSETGSPNDPIKSGSEVFGGTFNHTVDEFGLYKLQAQFVAKACHPTDGCITAYPQPIKDGDFSHTTITLNIDGSNQSSSTEEMICDDRGDCVPPPLYEDCSAYYWEFNTWDNGPSFKIPNIESIACNLRNFGTWFLHEVIIWSFVPNFGRLSASFDNLANNFKNSLGLLWSPFDFIISTFKLFSGTIVNPTGHTCNIGNFSIFGSPSSPLELCKWRDQFPQLWSIMQLAIQSGISIGLIYMFWSLFRKGILGQSDNNDSEPELTGHEYVNDGKDGRTRRG